VTFTRYSLALKEVELLLMPVTVLLVVLSYVSLLAFVLFIGSVILYWTKVSNGSTSIGMISNDENTEG